MGERRYLAIDLKSFFASVECVERGLDPLTTNLVVADAARTEKTICLAVTPSLKAHGISGRARLFEVVQRVREVNAMRRQRAPGRQFSGKSCFAPELRRDPSLELDYIVAKPQMARYIDVSARVYQIYLGYVAPEDIHVYSIDEVFIDATAYLKTYGLTARELAKRIEPDADGVRIAELDEQSYRQQLWEHRPLTDFWRLGPGYARRLEAAGMHTMGDIAARAEWDEEWFYRTFGINAGLLLDHAWGVEPCTIADIKAYRPEASSLGAGQVLHRPYPNDKARLIVWEMTEQLALELVEKRLVTDQVVLTVGYDIENLSAPAARAAYRGAVVRDHYGRCVPKHAHGSEKLGRPTASARLMTEAMLRLFDRITDPALLVRRVNIAANHVLPERFAAQAAEPVQLELFSTPEEQQRRSEREEAELLREKRRQQTVVALRQRYGKNVILRGSNFLDGATMRERNGQIGGHRA